jgi:hypothetical protein
MVKSSWHSERIQRKRLPSKVEKMKLNLQSRPRRVPDGQGVI